MDKLIKFNAIVAMNNIDQGIGFKEGLPWNIKEDHDYYLRVAQTTENKNKKNAVIVGRITFKSIPKESSIFNSCIVILVSNTIKIEDLKYLQSNENKGIEIVKSMKEALNIIYNKYTNIVESIYSIGGNRIYEESLNFENFNIYYITRIFGNFQCDIFLTPKNFIEKLEKIDSKDLVKQEQLFKIKYNTLIESPNDKNIKYIFEAYKKIKKPILKINNKN